MDTMKRGIQTNGYKKSDWTVVSKKKKRKFKIKIMHICKTCKATVDYVIGKQCKYCIGKNK